MRYETWRDAAIPRKAYPWEIVRKVCRFAFWSFMVFGLYWTVVRALFAVLHLHFFE
jgi:hypothetical protein